MIILNIILFLVVLTLIVSIHEFGHYYFAKRAGVLAHEFSIGMGPAIYQKKKGETTFSIRGIPLGGYVAMSGEQADSQTEFIQKDQWIGLRLNEADMVTHLVLEPNLNSDVEGKVISFDLVGKNQEPLYINILVGEEEKRYEILRQALYDGGKKGQVQITPFERSYSNKNKKQRFMILFAGPLMNIILAFLILFFVGFFISKPVASSTKIADIAKDSALSYTDFQKGSVITHVNGQQVFAFEDIISEIYGKEIEPLKTEIRTDDGMSKEVTLGLYLQTMGISSVGESQIYYEQAIIGQSFGRAKRYLDAGDIITHMRAGDISKDVSSWNDVLAFAKELTTEQEITITVSRDGQLNEVTYDLISQNAIGKLGSSAIVIQLGIVQEGTFNLWYSLSYPFKKMWSDVSQMGTTLALLFNPNEKIGVGDLSGPVGIFSLVSSAAAGGVLSLLIFTAFLSINIGLLNLLPIPALDGGQILFLGVEAVTGKKIPHKVANIINNVTFYLLLALIIFVSYNDILRLF